MRGSQFYKPDFSDRTGQELMFARRARERNKFSMERDAPIFDFAVSSPRARKQTGPIHVTYNFSSAIRRHMFPLLKSVSGGIKTKRAYGAPGWSFRSLYEFLCDAFNGGVLFIDTYLDKVFEARPVYRRFLDLYAAIRDDINNEQFNMFAELPKKADGTPDRRFMVYKRFMDYKVWQDPIIKQNCQRIAKEIRHDIVVCLSTGKLPLRGHQGAKVSASTRKIRARLGGMVHADRLFYASGQLIHNLNIVVEINEKEVRVA